MKPSEEVARRRKRIRLRSLLSIASFAVLSSTYGVDGVSFSSYSTVLSGYGAYTVPWCGDFDGDGDNDCIIGTATSDVGYFENSGTASSYDFPSGSSPTTSNFLNFATSDSITYSSPWCGDMDNDGDLDCLVGASDGYVHYKENVGSASAPSFSSSFANDDYFSKDAGDQSSVECVDFDNDGDFDCIVGDSDGDIYYFLNSGSSSSPSFLTSDQSKNDLITVSGLGCTYSKPNCFDVDYDGDYDCIVGCADGSVYFFENVGDASSPSFGSYDTDYGSNFLADPGTYAAPYCVDMDGDGAPDCFVGEASNLVNYATNQMGPTSVPSRVPLPAPSTLPIPAPSILPIPAPSILPFPAPTSQPIPAPTNPIPTHKPTKMPTSSPTLEPTAVPSRIPTPAPTPLCPAGQYLAADKTCTNCAAGTFTSIANHDSSCENCVPGTSSTAGASECDDCAAGTIAAAAGASACTDCAAGTIAAAAGASACTDCAAGTIAAAAGASACTDCAAGTIAAAAGASACTDAEAGSFVAGTGSSASTLCAIGYYSAAGASVCSSCEEFDNGGGLYYAAVEGSTECDACECSGAKGAGDCDFLTGACTCTGLYVDSTTGNKDATFDADGSLEFSPDCADEQQIGFSIIVAYVTFFVFLAFITPMIFCSGAIAAVSNVWRKDFFVVVHELRLRHASAKALRLRADKKSKTKRQERYLENEFKLLDEHNRGEYFRLTFENAFQENGALRKLVEDDSDFFRESSIEDYREAFKAAERLIERRRGARTGLQPSIAPPAAPNSLEVGDIVHSTFSLPGLDFDGFKELITTISQREASDRTRREYTRLFQTRPTVSTLEHERDNLAAILGGASNDDRLLGAGGLDDARPGLYRGVSVTRQVGGRTRRRSTVAQHVENNGRIGFEDFLRAKQMDAFETRLEVFREALRMKQSKVEAAYEFWEDTGLRAMRHFGVPVVSRELKELVETVLSSSGMKMIKFESTNGKLVESKSITREQFRQIICLAKLKEAEAIWPESKYRSEFMKLPQIAGSMCGMVEPKYLSALLAQIHSTFDSITNKWSEGIPRGEVEKLVKEVEGNVEFGNSTGVLFFDDFVTLMNLYHDATIEADIIDKLRNKGFILRDELKQILIRLLIIPIVVAAVLIYYLFNLAIDCYLMASSMYSTERLEERLKTFQATIDALLPEISIPFGWLLRIINILGFSVNIGDGVTCEGMQAPCYLAINCMIIAAVICIFDTSMFTVLRVIPEDYKHPEPWLLKRCCPRLPTPVARSLEEFFIRGATYGSGKTMKYVIQILMLKATFSSFFWYWQDITQACEKQYTYTEKIAAYGSSAVFWVMFFPVLHLLFNTFIFGVAPASIDKDFGKQIGNARGEITSTELARHSFSNDQKFSMVPNDEEVWEHIASAKLPNAYRQTMDQTCRYYCLRRMLFECCSISKCFCKAWRADVIADESSDLFLHNPMFWQQPWAWYQYFLSQSESPGGGSRHAHAISKYLYTMSWKIWQMVKLTLGVWDNTLLKNMEIIERCYSLRLDREKDVPKHEEVLSAVGVSHTLLWQLIPGMVVLAKLGEHLNEAPIFVFDPTAAIAIAAGSPQLNQRDVTHHATDGSGAGGAGGAPTGTIDDDDDDDDDDDKAARRLRPPPPPQPPPPQQQQQQPASSAVGILRRLSSSKKLPAPPAPPPRLPSPSPSPPQQQQPAVTSAPPPSGLLRRLSSSKKLPAPPAPPPAPPALSDDAHVDDLLHHVEMRERRLSKAEDPPPRPPPARVRKQTSSGKKEQKLPVVAITFEEDKEGSNGVVAAKRKTHRVNAKPSVAPPRAPGQSTPIRVELESISDAPRSNNNVIMVEPDQVEMQLEAYNMISNIVHESVPGDHPFAANEDEVYWTLKVDCPLSEDEVKANESGMIVWFDSGVRASGRKASARRRRGGIGVCCCCKVFCTCCLPTGGRFYSSDASRVGVQRGTCGRDGKGALDGSFVEFLYYDTSTCDVGSTLLTSDERYGQGLETKPRYTYDGDRTKFQGLADTRIRFAGLPTEREPLFIPAKGCAVRFHYPGGLGGAQEYSSSKFKIHAVFAPKRPVTFKTSFKRRRLHWILFATMFASKAAISFSEELLWQVRALAVFLLACVVLGIDYAKEIVDSQNKERKQKSLLLNRKAWCSLLGNMVLCISNKRSSSSRSSADTFDFPQDRMRPSNTMTAGEVEML